MSVEEQLTVNENLNSVQHEITAESVTTPADSESSSATAASEDS